MMKKFHYNSDFIDNNFEEFFLPIKKKYNDLFGRSCSSELSKLIIYLIVKEKSADEIYDQVLQHQ
jgi:hypothetical protein